MKKFRNNLAKYLGANKPITIVDRGETVDYFWPPHKPPQQGDHLAHLKSPHTLQAPKLKSLIRAAEKLDRCWLKAEYRCFTDAIHLVFHLRIAPLTVHMPLEPHLDFHRNARS